MMKHDSFFVKQLGKLETTYMYDKLSPTNHKYKEGSLLGFFFAREGSAVQIPLSKGQSATCRFYRNIMI